MRTLMVLAALFLAGLAVEARDSEDPSSIPLGRTPSGLLTVPVTVRGKPFVFLLDTGSARSVLGRATAQAVGLLVTPGARMVGTTGTKEVGQAVVDELRVGSVVVERHPVVVTDLETLSRHDIKVDGLLGADVLTRAEMRLDFERGRMWLTPCRSCR